VVSRRPPGLGPNYRRLWGASAASNLADGVFWIALPLFAVQLTDSPTLVAGVAVAARLPWLLFALPAGALADRLDRRRAMAWVAGLRTVIAAGLAIGIAAEVVSLPVLYVAAFVLGVGETLFDTAAQSIMPSLVDRDQLSRANSRLYAVELVMNQFAGPILGGLLAAVAISLALGSSAVAFAFATAALVALRGSFRPIPAPESGPERSTSLVAEVREGLAYLRGHRLLRTLAVMVGVSNLAFSATFAVLVLYAVTPGPMGLTEVGYGLLLTTSAVGSITGSFVVPWLEGRLGRARLLTGCVVVFAAMLAVPGLTANPALVGVSFAVSGFAVVAWNVVTVSLRQRIVPDHLLGRVNATYRLVAWGGQPIGALLGGLVAETFGLRAVFLLASALSATLVVARVVVTDRAIAAAEEGAAEEGAAEGGPAGGQPGPASPGP
jgi:MFS family permease